MAELISKELLEYFKQHDSLRYEALSRLIDRGELNVSNGGEQ